MANTTPAQINTGRVNTFYGLDAPEANPQITGPQMITLLLEKFGCTDGAPTITATLTQATDSQGTTITLAASISGGATLAWFNLTLVDADGNEVVFADDAMVTSDTELVNGEGAPDFNLDDEVYVQIAGKVTGDCGCQFSEQFKVLIEEAEG
jgi:hypothetical protein